MREKEGDLRGTYASWKLLEEHYEKIKKTHLRELFSKDSHR